MGFKNYISLESDKQIQQSKEKVVFLMASVKGGSGKTYDSLALAFSLNELLWVNSNMQEKETLSSKAKVCVIDLDLSATNMLDLLSYIKNYSYGKVIKVPDSQKTIHRYLIQSVYKRKSFDYVIEPFIYYNTSINLDQKRIDFVIGSNESRIRRIFSSGRNGMYENHILPEDAKVLLNGFLNHIILQGYQYIIIDLQPGMEGLSQSAIEYFAHAENNHNRENSNKQVSKLLEKYDTHLCLCCTQDLTQVKSNIEWAYCERDLSDKMTKKHIIIKDNAEVLKDMIGNEDGQNHIKKTIEKYISQYAPPSDRKSIFDDVVILMNNCKYVNLICKKPYEEVNMNSSPDEDQPTFNPEGVITTNPSSTPNTDIFTPTDFFQLSGSNNNIEMNDWIKEYICGGVK